MTDEERRNRNPAIEVVRTTFAEIETHPIVTAADLEPHKVYVVQSARNIATLNYMGKGRSLHPVTFDLIATHHFHGPRAGLNVFLAAQPDGSFTDAEGTRITIRRWTGEDQ
jgi:hypothetical protein